MSLKTVLVFPFVCLTLLALALVGYVSMRNGQQAVNNVAHQLRNEINTRIVEHLDNFLSIPHRINRNNAIVIGQGAVQATDQASLTSYFQEQVQVFDTVTSIYFSNTAGGLANAGREGSQGRPYIIYTKDFKSGPFYKYAVDQQGERGELLLTLPSFDGRTRPWYRNAVSKKTGIWSDVYILFTGQDMSICASRTVYGDGGELLGVTAVDLFLSHLSDFLSTLEVGRTGHSFIMERSGLLIASSTGETLLRDSEDESVKERIRVTDSATRLVREAAGALAASFGGYDLVSGNREFDFRFDNQAHFGQVTAFQDPYGLDWLIVTAIPQNDFMAHINANNRITFFLMILTLVVAAGVSVFIAGKILKPVSDLRRFARSLSKGNWSQVFQGHTRITEIQALATSFHHMAGQLKQMFDGLNNEIAERRQAQAALKTSHERFLTVLNSIDATIYVADMDTHEIIFMNQHMIKLFGRDMTGEICWSSFRGESGPCPHCTNDRLLDDQGGHTGVHVWHDKNPVTGRWFINHDRAIEWVDGRMVRLQVATDITEMKKMEKALRQAQKMESIGTLAGGIAHDFNNILFPIVGMSELLMEDLEEGGQAYDNAREILTAAKRGSNLVRQILAFSRQTGNETVPVSLQQVLDEVLALSQATLPSDIVITRDIQDGCGMVMADPTQIHQVVMNLVTNTFHALEPGGGKISIQLEEKLLSGRALPDSSMEPGPYALLSVADNGCGISAAVKDRIFDPYFTTKEQGKGTGLGLSMVHGIVKSCRGDIKVYSEIGKGTEFQVYLPVTDPLDSRPETGDVSEDSSKKFPLGDEHILLVDDETAIVQIESQILDRLGYRVTACSGSLEALETFRAGPDDFDLVLTDMTMPDMTGDKLAGELIVIRPDIPVILCTGFSELINEENAAAHGIRGFLMKPVNISELAGMIRKVLDDYHDLDE